jgi:hypothetical protein
MSEKKNSNLDARALAHKMQKVPPKMTRFESIPKPSTRKQM